MLGTPGVKTCFRAFAPKPSLRGASATKQSSAPCAVLDCFASLAMTKTDSLPALQTSLRRRPRCDVRLHIFRRCGLHDLVEAEFVRDCRENREKGSKPATMITRVVICLPTSHSKLSLSSVGNEIARFRGRFQLARYYFAPAFCAYSQEACDSGTVRLADSMALALAAVPSRTRPAIPWVMPASRNKL